MGAIYFRKRNSRGRVQHCDWIEENDGTTDRNINLCDVPKCLMLCCLYMELFNRDAAITLDTRIFVRSHIYLTVEDINIYGEHITIIRTINIYTFNVSIVVANMGYSLAFHGYFTLNSELIFYQNLVG